MGDVVFHFLLCNATEIVVDNDILLIKFHGAKYNFFLELTK